MSGANDNVFERFGVVNRVVQSLLQLGGEREEGRELSGNIEPSGSVLHGRNTYHKGCVQFFHLGDQNSHTSNYEYGYEELCGPVGGCNVAIADSGDCHHHKPVGVEERETKVDTHEMVQQTNPGRTGRRGFGRGMEEGARMEKDRDGGKGPEIPNGCKSSAHQVKLKQMRKIKRLTTLARKVFGARSACRWTS